LEFAAVEAARVEFVANQANRNTNARVPFAGNLAILKGRFVFPGVDHLLNLDDDGAANRASG
jgi:hypothetical protein